MAGRQVLIFDTTLRDGEQAPGAAMTLGEKLRIAKQLAALRVDIIEAGFPVSSPTQFEAVQRIASDVEGPVICALARTVPGDIQAAAEALCTGSKKRIHTFVATSDIHLMAKFADSRFGQSLVEKRQTILRMADESVRMARAVTDDVEFSAEDAGRTDIGFLCEAVAVAVEAGATTINIPDTTGYCLPKEYAEIFKTVTKRCGIGSDVVLSTHCHDDLGLAVANSLAGIVGGARQVECTVNGIGERAGNASLEEVVMALAVRGARFDAHTNVETPLLTETSRMVSVATGFSVPPNKAVVGGNAFSHEAGIHQHGVLQSRETYEIMRAEDVGQRAERIRLGRHSGRRGLFSRLTKMGINVSDDGREEIYSSFVELADRKKEISDEDLVHLVREAEGKPERTYYRLDQMHVSCGTARRPRAEVLVFHYGLGTTCKEVAAGDGPVNAIYKAIDQATGSHHDLNSYAIRSVTEGKDAMGEVTVLVEDGGAFFRGVARSTDVLKASADAYIEALNQLESFRSDRKSVEFVGGGIIQSFEGGME